MEGTSSASGIRFEAFRAVVSKLRGLGVGRVGLSSLKPTPLADPCMQLIHGKPKRPLNATYAPRRSSGTCGHRIDI